MHSSTSTSSEPGVIAAGRVAAMLGGFAAGLVAAVISLELLFRLLPVATSTATGYYFDPMLLTYPAHHRFVSATGWNLQNAQRNRANNFGYLADHDFLRDPRAVALIGDSFVEGSMLSPQDRFGAQLESRLTNRRVYAMGSPGTALLDYAERIRFAAEKFGVRDFVLLLEHGDLAQSLCGSGNVQAQCLDRQTLQPRIEKQQPPGLLKRLMRQSALAQYLFSQLKLDPAGWLHSLLAPRPATDKRLALRDPAEIGPATLNRVLEEFFARTAPYRTGRLVLVLADGAPGMAQTQLMPAARQQGPMVMVIDGAPLLSAEAARAGLSMHVSPHDGHLNRLAFAVLATEVAQLLRDDEKPPVTSQAR